MINIQDIIPFMKDGWVAMDRNRDWWWYSEKPSLSSIQWRVQGGITDLVASDFFDIAPANDWTKSLIKVDEK